jgi:hypothetical protein
MKYQQKAKYLIVHRASLHGNLLARQPDLVVSGKRSPVLHPHLLSVAYSGSSPLAVIHVHSLLISPLQVSMICDALQTYIRGLPQARTLHDELQAMDRLRPFLSVTASDHGVALEEVLMLPLQVRTTRLYFERYLSFTLSKGLLFEVPMLRLQVPISKMPLKLVKMLMRIRK